MLEDDVVLPPVDPTTGEVVEFPLYDAEMLTVLELVVLPPVGPTAGDVEVVEL